MRTPVLVLLTAMTVASCAPSISPLYRDYAYREPTGVVSDDEMQVLRAALVESGWTVAPSPVGNVLATEPRTFRSWGLYRIEVELEVAPVAGPYVRVLLHPYRRWFTGGRGKIPYLRRGLARSALESFTAALEESGLEYVGTAQQRDRAFGAR